MSRRWWLLASVAGVVIVVAIVFGIQHSGGTRDSRRVATKPVLVGSISLNASNPSPGDPVIATITLKADRSMHLDAVMLSVRDAQGRSADAAGRGFDFADAGPLDIGSQARRVTVAHQFQARGTYVYFLRYRVGRDWHVLPPYATFTVG